jgi:hypothetical protein
MTWGDGDGQDYGSTDEDSLRVKDARLGDLMDDCGMKKPHAKRILKYFGVQL